MKSLNAVSDVGSSRPKRSTHSRQETGVVAKTPRVCTQTSTAYSWPAGRRCSVTTGVVSSRQSMPRRPKTHEQRQYERRRRHGPSASKVYGRRWQKAREAFLRAHPTCVSCAGVGRVTAATQVDHVQPHRGDQVLFWDVNNWQGLCHSCHSKKTMDDGRFG